MRACALLLSMCLPGCLAVTHHQNLDALSIKVLHAERGTLTVIARDGSKIRVDAPFRAVAEKGALFVQSGLMPTQQFEGGDLERVDIAVVSPVRTGVAIGVAAVVVASVAGAIGLGFAMKNVSFAGDWSFLTR